MIVTTSQRLRTVAILLGAVMVVGTGGYMAIEGWGILDSFYMTIITMATVGYLEVHPMSASGRLFTVFVIIIGVGATFYAFTVFFESLVEGRLRALIGRQRLSKGLRRMKDHYIVCGYGRVGQQVVGQMLRRDRQVVVIENDVGVQDELAEQNIVNIPGDATDDRVLIGAGVKNARGLVVALPHDADNVLITLTARQLNPSLMIVARTDSERTRRKLILAGANTVVSPHEIGGLRMAVAALFPNVVDFMQFGGEAEGAETLIEEIQIGPHSPIAGTTLRASPIRAKLGLTVVALRPHGGAIRFNPDPDTVIAAGDILLVVGGVDQLATLRDMTASTRAGGEASITSNDT